MPYLSRLTFGLLLASSFALQAGTSLSKAVISGSLSAVQDSVKGGEDVNEIDKWGWTPLMWAVHYRYLPITEFLLSKGADPNIQATKAYGSMMKGATAMIIAGYYGLDDHAAALAKAGARGDIADDSGRTAMAYAKQYEFQAVVEILNKPVVPRTKTTGAPEKPSDKAPANTK